MTYTRWSRQDPAGVSPEFRMFDLEVALEKARSELSDALWRWTLDLEATGSDEPLRRGGKELTQLEESVENMTAKLAAAIQAVTNGRD